MKLSPASIFPRLRPSGGKTSLPTEASIGRPRLGGLDVQLGMNRTVLSGTMVDGPQRERSRAITVILLSFAAPDERVGPDSGLCEVEIEDELADPHRSRLQHGATVLVVGELNGAGGLWAKDLAAELPR
jgi:hypothetical protein